jgi:hypothetical protein
VYINAYTPYNGNSGQPFFFSRVLSYNIHPNFDDGPNQSDVAVVTMAIPLDVSQYPPIQLVSPNFELQDTDLVRVYGFGRVEENNAMLVPTLQTVQLPFISHSTCNKYYPSRLLQDQFCAGYEKGGADACYGDSGGPMVYFDSQTNKYIQVGLVSWGEGCGQPNKPGVYTNLSFYFNWIQQVVCQESIFKKTSETELCKNYVGTSNIFAQTCRPLGVACEYGGQCCTGKCGNRRGVCKSENGSSSSFKQEIQAPAPTFRPTQIPTRAPTLAPTKSKDKKSMEKKLLRR